MSMAQQTDSVQTVSEPAPRQLHLYHETDAPTSAADRALCSRGCVAWTGGVEPEARPVWAGSDAGVMVAMLLCLVLMSFNYRNFLRLVHNFGETLLKGTRRGNAFDDSTANESRSLLLMLLQTCVLEGVALYIAVVLGAGVAGRGPVALYIGVFTALAVMYYMVQLGAYATVAYVFAPHGCVGYFLRSFNTSQALMGAMMMLPTLAMLFNPAWSAAMLVVIVGLYVVARLLFVRTGFSIFYHNFSSLLYFFLYLCTLEIVPLLVVYRAAVYLYQIL